MESSQNGKEGKWPSGSECAVCKWPTLASRSIPEGSQEASSALPPKLSFGAVIIAIGREDGQSTGKVPGEDLLCN